MLKTGKLVKTVAYPSISLKLIPQSLPSIVYRNRDLEKRQRKYKLHNSDHKAPVHDELTHNRASLIRQPPVPQEQIRQMLKLSDREIRGQSGLLPLLPDDADPNIRHQNHAHIVAAIAFALKQSEYLSRGQFFR